MLPKVGDTIGGKYTLEGVLGLGGMGAVFRAKNLRTGRRVALKWILPTLRGTEELRARLLREARAMGLIEHPNVCAVFDVGEEGDAVYLVMEHLTGRTLRSMLDEGRLGIEEACQILLSAMQGVAAAHLAGVVHRDLKPDNLFVCFDADGRRGATKVLDFGVSKIVEGGKDSDRLTKTGTAVGTPHYMSPEQIVGARDVDARSDVYALGAILFQAITGRMPFDAEHFSALVVRIATASPESFLESAPAEAAALDPIVHRAIARRPEDRYPDVQSFAAALEPFAGGARFEAPKARPRSVPPPASGSEHELATRAQGASAPRAADETDGGNDPLRADRSAPGAGIATTLAAGPLPAATPPPMPSIGIEIEPPSSSSVLRGTTSPGADAEPTAPLPPASTLSPRTLGVAAVVVLLVAAALAFAGSRMGPDAPRTEPSQTSAPQGEPAPSTVVEAQPEHVTPLAETPEPAVPEPVVPVASPTGELVPVPSAPAQAADSVVDAPREDERAGSRPVARGGHRAVSADRASETAPASETSSETSRTGSGRSGTISTDDF